MGYADYSVKNACDIVFSQKESDRFNLSISRAICTSWTKDSEICLSKIAKSEHDVIILRTKDSLPDAHSFEPKFSALSAGDLVYWSTGKNPTFPGLLAGMSYVPAAGLLEEFSQVIKSSFAGYVNHYSYNPLFKEFSPEDAYLDWANSRASSTNSSTFAGLLLMDGESVGAISGVQVGDDIEVELAGIHGDFQGRGFYGSLLGGFWNSINTTVDSRLVISTQSENAAVQSAWKKLELQEEFRIYTTHLIANRLL